MTFCLSPPPTAEQPVKREFTDEQPVEKEFPEDQQSAVEKELRKKIKVALKLSYQEPSPQICVACNQDI